MVADILKNTSGLRLGTVNINDKIIILFAISQISDSIRNYFNNVSNLKKIISNYKLMRER